ncbi:uncharacterized protein LOC128715009 [Anopheles marshallii]|uniref:uncharacterized protein LOC128715009 n=1 Tax=Anopheles marshallii TaxID=1521116 RepID=UPI00237C062C|nr:uncharacterized protein LOC128715009 [Anopheles marshallii]
MTSCKKKIPSKLCRRTYFLQTGTAPTISEMANELGPDLASVVVGTLQPSQRSAVQPDCIALPEGLSPPHESDTIRGQIHEHILQIGGNISHRVDGYWRQRVKQTAAESVSPDEVDFLKFEYRQKINIARDEERKRYDELLRKMEKTLEQRFWEEKGDLHRGYAEARKVWGEFVCRKVRKQAKDMLCKMACYYRTKLEREVTCRMQQEKSRIMKEMEKIVKTAVDQQKHIDDRAIQWLVYQYEELLKFISEYNQCLDTVEMTREICRLHYGQQKCHSTQMSTHSLIFEDRLDNHERSVNRSLTVDLEEGIQIASTSLSKFNVFVVNQCLPEPVAESTVSDEASVSTTTMAESLVDQYASEDYESICDEDSVTSTLEKVVIGGLTYAQPKYYKKVYNDMFRDVAMHWETLNPPEKSGVQDVSCSASSDDTKTIDSDSGRSEPSYRESYDPIAEMNDVLGLNEDVLPVEETILPEEFGELYDLSKSEEEISLVADRFAEQYIRATSDDFEAMFPKSSDAES